MDDWVNMHAVVGWVNIRHGQQQAIIDLLNMCSVPTVQTNFRRKFLRK